MTYKVQRHAKSTIRLKFFDLLFGDEEGYVCIATSDKDAPKATFNQQFFEWPKEAIEVENHILDVERTLNVYFCINILSKAQRRKDFCLPANLVWADLDAVNPKSIVRIPPPIVIRSSPGRWQAIWRLSTKIPAYQAEDYSRRMSYLVGADKSGWDLGQLLRVPLTQNFKYDPPPQIQLELALEATAKPLLFESIQVDVPEPTAPMPMENSEAIADNIIYKYSMLLKKGTFNALYTIVPDDDTDWSAILWRFLHECFKVGMTSEEVFVLAREAKCNKYARDGRPIEHLWRDVLKAADLYHVDDGPNVIQMPELVIGPNSTTPTFVDTYREWAAEATDAIPAFHDLCIFVVLSAIISTSVRLETSAGMVTPNIWGLILGDSTLTRKTTAMKLALDFLLTMDKEMLIATDGTAEGLLSGLATRPNRSSIFHKDEVSGFFESMSKKEYLAGMQETLTALYDVPPIYARRLRKETIILESPAFVLLCGGVTERVYSSVNESFVLSGFLPRFLVVSGDAEVSDRRPLGPPTQAGLTKRPGIMEKLANVYETYATEINVKIGGQNVVMPARYTARLTADAWALNAEIEGKMLKTAKDSPMPDMALPTFDRLTRSMLKMAVVLGCERQLPVDDAVMIEEQDIINAASYIQEWGQDSINLIINAGRGYYEKMFDKIITYVLTNPGALRSTLMKRYHLNSKDVGMIMQTLEDRGQIRKEQRGRGFAYWIT